jgi:TatD DNase family protein
MTLIDTHAHLDESAFESDVDAVVRNAAEAGIEAVLTIGITRASCERALALAERFEIVRAAVGIQPNYVSQVEHGDWEEIVAMAERPEVLAVGETGLDKYWDYAPLDLQAEYFDRHLELARRLDKPFIVHCRDADAEVVAQLARDFERGPLKGVMHSFCGSAQTARACLDMGMHISFAGMVTFKKNDALRAVAKTIPLERVLIETDAPYLAPQPVRGKRNEPAYVRHTAECLAEVFERSLEEIARITTDNARRLFRMD